MPPPRHLAPLDPDHTASPPAFDTSGFDSDAASRRPHPSGAALSGSLSRLPPVGSTAPRLPAPCPLSSRTPSATLPPAPPPAAERLGMRFVSSELLSGRFGSRIRLRSRRRKWNLFDDRPLFHLPRRLLRRRGWLGVQRKLNTFGKRVRLGNEQGQAVDPTGLGLGVNRVWSPT